MRKKSKSGLYKNSECKRDKKRKKCDKKIFNQSLNTGSNDMRKTICLENS